MSPTGTSTVARALAESYEEITNSMTAVGVDTTSSPIRSPDLPALAAACGCAHRRAGDLASLQASVREAPGAPVPTGIEPHQHDVLSQPSGGWYR